MGVYEPISHVTRLSGTVQVVRTHMAVGNYENLSGKPSINGVVLEGDLTSENLGLGSSGGMSLRARNLLLGILRSAVFTADKSAQIDELEAVLAASVQPDDGNSSGDTGDSGDSGGTTEPEEPPATDDITADNGVLTILTVGSTVSADGNILTIG